MDGLPTNDFADIDSEDLSILGQGQDIQLNGVDFKLSECFALKGREVLMDMPRLTVNDTQAERTQPKESTE
jgi:hypothetical protein